MIIQNKTRLFHTLLPPIYQKLVETPIHWNTLQTHRHVGKHRSVQYMSVYVRVLLIACVMYKPKWTDAVHTCTTYVGSLLPSSARYFVTARKVGYDFINTFLRKICCRFPFIRCLNYLCICQLYVLNRWKQIVQKSWWVINKEELIDHWRHS